MNYEQSIDYLYGIPKFTKEPSLMCAERILEELGSPEKNMRIIHVAGTNGKGSVCAYISSVIKVSGRKVGLFTSPHLVSMEERIRINGINVSKELFLEAFMELKECEDRLKEETGRFSFFEYLFGMAMYCFKKESVEYAVMETGLGGRLDATNAVAKPFVTVITPVSLDHVSVLGDTVSQVAMEKAGIIKKDVPVVFWAENPEVKNVIEKVASEKNSQALPIDKGNYEILQISDKSVDFCTHNMYHKNGRYSVSLATALYQVENALLSLEALYYMATKDAKLTDEVIIKGIKEACWQGRFQEVAEGVIVDGAHNEAGILSFIEAVSTRESVIDVTKKVLLFAVMGDKDYDKMIELICKNLEFETVIITRSGGDRGMKPEELVEIFSKNTAPERLVAIEDWKEAFEKGRELAAHNKGTLYCVGSLYLVGAVLEEYGGSI